MTRIDFLHGRVSPTLVPSSCSCNDHRPTLLCHVGKFSSHPAQISLKTCCPFRHTKSLTGAHVAFSSPALTVCLSLLYETLLATVIRALMPFDISALTPGVFLHFLSHFGSITLPLSLPFDMRATHSRVYSHCLRCAI
jgi:hypothetical protein